MRPLLFILASTLLFISCKKDDVVPGNSVEIYLLKTSQMVAGKCKIDPSASTLQDTPAIKNKDILEYSKTRYQFKLSDLAFQKVKAFGDFTVFAVTVDKQVIYFGFFKPNYSSSSCDHSITMDIDWTTGNQIDLKLGYPGVTEGIKIEDLRNHPKLIATLKNQGKLR